MLPRNPAAMDTGRLRAIQEPRSARELLLAFASASEHLPPASQEVQSFAELPAALQRLAKQGEADDVVWVARAENMRIWFFSATPSLELSRERRRPVLKVRIHNEHGILIESLTCVYTKAQEWKRCT
jgi:hypothetical protein